LHVLAWLIKKPANTCGSQIDNRKVLQQHLTIKTLSSSRSSSSLACAGSTCHTFSCHTQCATKCR